MESRNIEYRDRSYGYNYPCGTPNTSSTIVDGVLISYETVESYRGPQQFVDVCGKKRKRFHAFQRYAMSIKGRTNMHWCHPRRVMYAEDYPMLPLMWYCDAPTAPYWVANGRGELPYVGKVLMAELGEELRAAVIRDMYNKLNSPRFDGAVFVAELEESLTSIAKLLGGAAMSLVKTRVARKNLKNLLSNPEGLWLWFRYMLMPTMMDVESIISALNTQPKIDRVQDGNRIEESSTGTAGQYWSYNRDYLDMKWQSSVKGGFGGAIDVSARSDPNPYGFGSIDLVRAAWERIPFSFIFDWFVNVGDWLQSLRSLEVAIVQSYATYAIESKTIMLPGSYQTLDGDAELTCFFMERIIDVEPPNLPLIDKRWMNVLRIIDSISLIIGTLKGILKRR